jgi:CMP-N-acetylneuraminic acid synthetase
VTTAVALVPLKLTNERLPGKNTMPFGDGRPLVAHILETLLEVRRLNDIVVYCSDSSVAELLPEGVRHLTRSATLDRSSTRINEVLRAFADDVPADVYVLTHATAPLLSAAAIQAGIEAVLDRGYDSALSVVRQQDFGWFGGEPINYDPANIPRTQDLEPLMVETTGLYVYERALITEQNRRTGDSPFLVEVSRVEAADVNEAIDFEIANALYRWRENDETR